MSLVPLDLTWTAPQSSVHKLKILDQSRMKRKEQNDGVTLFERNNNNMCFLCESGETVHQKTIELKRIQQLFDLEMWSFPKFQFTGNCCLLQISMYSIVTETEQMDKDGLWQMRHSSAYMHNIRAGIVFDLLLNFRLVFFYFHCVPLQQNLFCTVFYCAAAALCPPMWTTLLCFFPLLFKEQCKKLVMADQKSIQ